MSIQRFFEKCSSSDKESGIRNIINNFKMRDLQRLGLGKSLTAANMRGYDLQATKLENQLADVTSRLNARAGGAGSFLEQQKLEDALAAVNQKRLGLRDANLSKGRRAEKLKAEGAPPADTRAPIPDPAAEAAEKAAKEATEKAKAKPGIFGAAQEFARTNPLTAGVGAGAAGMLAYNHSRSNNSSPGRSVNIIQ